jgi:hypothetical protein
MVRHELYTYDNELMGFHPVLSRVCAGEAPRYANIDAAYATAQTGAIRGNVKVFAPGYFAGSIADSTKVRLLPRTVVATNSAASATSLVVKPGTSGIFVANDALSILAPSARVNIVSASSGWADADTVTVTVSGIVVVTAIATADIGGSLTATNATVAAKVLAAIKANPYLRSRVDGRVIAGSTTSSDIVLWSTDFSSMRTLTAADTGTNGTATASSGTFVPNAAIATISAVNTATDTLTIGSASISVPAGVPIGVSTSYPYDANGTPYGLISPSQAADLLYRESQNYGLYTDATVYRARLPYWDGELAALFPEITLV